MTQPMTQSTTPPLPPARGMDLDDDDHETRIPVIRLWDCMLVPLQGELSDAQAARLTDDVLSRIERAGCAALIVDASGLWLVDSHLCAVLAELARAASLMGTRTILSGLRPGVTLTLLAMDMTPVGVGTALNLEQALEAAGIGPWEEDAVPKGSGGGLEGEGEVEGERGHAPAGGARP